MLHIIVAVEDARLNSYIQTMLDRLPSTGWRLISAPHHRLLVPSENQSILITDSPPDEIERARLKIESGNTRTAYVLLVTALSSSTEDYHLFDDFVTNNNILSELVNRVRALATRFGVYFTKNALIDLASSQAWGSSDLPVILTPLECQLLRIIFRHQGVNGLSVEEIARISDGRMSRASIRVTIGTIRSKLGEDIIHTENHPANYSI